MKLFSKTLHYRSHTIVPTCGVSTESGPATEPNRPVAVAS